MRGYLDEAMLQYLNSGVPPASVLNKRQGFEHVKRAQAASAWEEYQAATVHVPEQRVVDPIEKKEVVQMHYCGACNGKRKGTMFFERYQGQRSMVAVMFICKKCGEDTNPSNRR